MAQGDHGRQHQRRDAQRFHHHLRQQDGGAGPLELRQGLAVQAQHRGAVGRLERRRRHRTVARVRAAGAGVMNLQTQFPFTLPKGYVDGEGHLHRSGVMRLATARDEIEPLRDLRVQENDAYLTVVMLSRVISELGTIRTVTPNMVEGLFAVDLAFLQEFYGIINFGDPAELGELEEAYRHPLPASFPPGNGNDNGNDNGDGPAPEPAMAAAGVGGRMLVRKEGSG